MDERGPDRASVDFEVEERDDATVVHVRGDLDASGAPALRAQLVSTIETAPRRVVLDLSRVDFVDSLGLSMLVAAHRRAEEVGIELHLASPSPASRRVLEITRLTDLFTIIE
jgi:anti-sigma B factor antagonist